MRSINWPSTRLNSPSHRPRGKHVVFSVALISATALAITGCTGPSSDDSPSSNSEPISGGNLTIAQELAPPNLDPNGNTDNESIWMEQQIMESLYTVDSSGTKLIPSLATSYTVSDDKLTYTFKLRDGVKFSNGNDLTSDDVKFSLDQARLPDASWQSLVAAIDSVTANSDNSVTIHLSYPSASLVAVLTFVSNGIVPKDYAGMSRDAFFEKPIGTGPFMVSEAKKGVSTTMVRNPHYWQEGKPYLDSVTWQVVPDASTREVQLKAGQIDIAEYPAMASMDALASISGITAKLFPSTYSYFIVMNQADVPAFGDVNVRRAIAHAVNRDGLIAAGTFGHGTPANSFIPPTVPFNDPNAKYPAYDIDAAKAEMAKSAYPGGFSVKFSVASGDPSQAAMSQLLQQDFAKIGVKLELIQKDQGEIYSTLHSMTYEMAFNPWTYDFPDPDEALTGYNFDGTKVDKGDIGLFYSGAGDEQLKSLTTDSRVAVDSDARQEVFNKIQEYMADQVPMVPLYYKPYPWAYSNKVQNFNVYPTGNYPLTDTWLAKS